MKIADGWETSPLPVLLRLMKSGGTPDTSCSDYYGGDIPFVSIEDMTASSRYLESTIKTLTNEGLKHSSAWIVPANAILYSIYATLGLPRINAMPVATNQAILALINDPNKIDRDYLYYWFEFTRTSVVSLSSQTTQSNLGATTVKSLSVDHPTKLAEQAKIAGVLSTVDRAIEQTEALIAKQERIKTGLMQDLFTRGIDEHGNIRSEETHQFKDSPLGGIPVEWEVTTLGTAVGRNKGSVQTGPFGSQLHAEDYRETGVPIITVEHLSQNRILHRNLPLVGEEDYRRLVKYTLCEGDLVFSRVGAIDRCSYVSKDENGWLFSGRCFRVRSGQEINSRYLSYQLNHDKARNWILNNSVGTTMACLNTSILSMTPVLLPQQKEQAQVARLLDFISDAIQYELLRKAKLNSLKTGLMQDLLTGKIRVTSLLDNMEVTNR